MKTLTVRLPEKLAAEIEAESRARGVAKSDVVRERLQTAGYQVRRQRPPPSFLESAGDLIGGVKGDRLPSDVSARFDHYLRQWGYGKNRSGR